MGKQKVGVICRCCDRGIELADTSKVALVFSVACPHCFERGYYTASSAATMKRAPSSR